MRAPKSLNQRAGQVSASPSVLAAGGAGGRSIVSLCSHSQSLCSTEVRSMPAAGVSDS